MFPDGGVAVSCYVQGKPKSRQCWSRADATWPGVDEGNSKASRRPTQLSMNSTW